MAVISVEEANAWADKSKLILDALDTELVVSVTDQVFARISPVYDTTSWSTPLNTPSIVRKIIAMLYVAWVYERTYSEDGGQNTYSMRLFEQAYGILDGVADGTLAIEDVNLPGLTTVQIDAPGYYPSEPVFTMGQIW